MTAKSLLGSVPITFALYDFLLVNVTLISSAPFTTWLLVTIYPSAVINTPLPLALCSGITLGPPKKSPNISSSPKKSEKGFLCLCWFASTRFAFVFVLICTTAGEAELAAGVKSTVEAGAFPLKKLA